MSEPEVIVGRLAIEVDALVGGEAKVYRLYDAQQRLLYVGMTTMPLASRLAAHRAGKRWWPEAAFVTSESYETREDAARAELWAIQQEAPRYNHEGRIRQLILVRAPKPQPPRPPWRRQVVPEPQRLGRLPIDEALRAALDEQGWGIEELARRAGVDSDHLGEILSSERSPGIGMLEKLCEALDLRLWALFAEAERLREAKR